MEVLLKKDIDRLGSKDELVEVKNGYGRNFLIPKGLAILATDSIKKMHAETLKQRAHKDNQLKEEAGKIYEKMSKKTFQVPAKVGENGKIFGRGSCDMKAGLAAYLEVLRKIKERNIQLSGDLIIAGVIDEEHAMIGSIDFGINGPIIDYAIIAEPTNLKICPSHKSTPSQIINIIRTK